MLTKCPLDPHAYYDPWGNRHLLFTEWEFWRAERWATQLRFLTSFAA